MLKKSVQNTGVAPTDDGFTIIGPGKDNFDRDGPTLIGDPDLGFSSLKSFGPVLVNHTKLKVRSDIAIKDFMLVDSPGMIDSPVQSKEADGDHSRENVMDRGYNFEAVCRWYAERADVILLFFDPDKPGTTGETLSILTNSLVGLDNKMHIILNKADQFRKIHDFARAYGSLCWNLSKVIPRKDLPRIHTMCLPQKLLLLSDEDLSESAEVSKYWESHTTTLSSQEDIFVDGQQSITPSKTSNSKISGDHSNQSIGKLVDDAASVISAKSFMSEGMKDLDQARLVIHFLKVFIFLYYYSNCREEVIKEVFNAPRRRVDNEISRFSDTIGALQMHCRIVDNAVGSYIYQLWRARIITAATTAAAIAFTMGMSYVIDLVEASDSSAVSTKTVTPKSPSESGNLRGTVANAKKAAISKTATSAPTNRTDQSFLSELWQLRTKRSIMTVTSIGSGFCALCTSLWQGMRVKACIDNLTSRAGLENIFRELYAKPLIEKDESVLSISEIVLDHLSINFSAVKLTSAWRVSKADFAALDRVMKEDLPNLRRKASPNYPTLTPKPSNTPTIALDGSAGKPVILEVTDSIVGDSIVEAEQKQIDPAPLTAEKKAADESTPMVLEELSPSDTKKKKNRKKD